jgi:hypothetical protein
MAFFRGLGKRAFMPRRIKQTLKQLRKALQEQRAYEMFLTAERSRKNAFLSCRSS